MMILFGVEHTFSSKILSYSFSVFRVSLHAVFWISGGLGAVVGGLMGVLPRKIFCRNKKRSHNRGILPAVAGIICGIMVFAIIFQWHPYPEEVSNTQI